MTDYQSARAAQRMLLGKLRINLVEKQRIAAEAHNALPSLVNTETMVTRAYTAARAMALGDVIAAIDATIGELK